MREYELVFVVHPDLDEAAFNDVLNKVRGWIVDEGGEVQKTDLWGKRRLAYPIRKVNEGQYVLMQTQMAPKFCVALERNLRLLEPVLRFELIVKE